MDDQFSEKMRVVYDVIDAVTKHPDWGNDIVAAVFRGVYNALAAERARAASADIACRTALALATRDRLPPKAKAGMGAVIARYLESLGEDGLSRAEKEALGAMRKMSARAKEEPNASHEQ